MASVRRRSARRLGNYRGPCIGAEHGKVVVAMLNDSEEATLKQLVVDGGAKYLKPFNNSYPTMPINGNCTIIGVVKQVIQDFKL